MNFRVGQKVVCVDASACRYQGNVLKYGEVYTISGFDSETESWCSRVGVLIDGVSKYRSKSIGHLIGFRPERFRPIQERKTDIGFAHEILRKHSKRKPVDATA